MRACKYVVIFIFPCQWLSHYFIKEIEKLLHIIIILIPMTNYLSDSHLIPFPLVGRLIEQGNKKKYPPAVGPPIGPSCDQCGQKFHLGGPVWMPPMHDTEFVKKLLGKIKRKPELYGTSDRMIGESSHVMHQLCCVPILFLCLPPQL